MKLTALLACTCLAFPANAGGLPLEIPVEPEVIQPERMGSNAEWLVPLLLIGLIVIAVNSSDDDPDEPDGCTSDCNPPPDCITKSCALIAEFGTDDPSEMTKEQRGARRDYYHETGGASGTDDWSGFAAWWAAQ